MWEYYENDDQRVSNKPMKLYLVKNGIASSLNLFPNTVYDKQ